MDIMVCFSSLCNSLTDKHPPKRLRWKGLTLPAHKWGSHLSAVNSFYRSLTLVFNCLGYKSKWKVARNDCKPLWEK